MEKLLTRKEAAGMLHISLKTLDAARESGQLAYIQYTENGSVYFTEQMLQEYMARSIHRARPIETRYTYRNPRNKPRYYSKYKAVVWLPCIDFP